MATRFVLLEIAKQPEPERQRTLWDQGKAGELTVRQARTTPRLPPESTTRTICIALTDATVCVTFQSGEPSRSRIEAALRSALERVGSDNWE